MAGRARFHALKDEFERRTRDLFEDDAQATHLDYICERVENATTTKAIAAEISQSLGHECTYARMMSYLRECFGDVETDHRIDTARVRASHLLPEEGKELVDAAGLTTAEVAKASSQAKQRNWMAERYNRERYGSSKGVNVSISVGELHLAALKATPVRVTVATQQALVSPVVPVHNTLDSAQHVDAHSVTSE